MSKHWRHGVQRTNVFQVCSLADGSKTTEEILSSRQSSGHVYVSRVSVVSESNSSIAVVHRILEGYDIASRIYFCATLQEGSLISTRRTRSGNSQIGHHCAGLSTTESASEVHVGSLSSDLRIFGTGTQHSGVFDRS